VGFYSIINADTQTYSNKMITASSKGDKIFIREYTYNASDTDSKVSSRKKAITQLKSILSEEVGVHIESSFEIKTTTKNNINNKYVKSEIHQLSANITKLKILDEKWNGVRYYIKASVKINEEQTMILLLEAIKAKASKKDVIRLNKILDEQNKNLDKSYSRIQELQKQLVFQEITNQASKNELSNTKKELLTLQKTKQMYDNKVLQQQKEISKIKKIIKKAKNRIKSENNKACLMEKGMTKKEVLKAIGNPTGLTDYSCRGQDKKYYPLNGNCIDWYYGVVNLEFGKNKILKYKMGCN
jgi:hypothetical protein